MIGYRVSREEQANRLSAALLAGGFDSRISASMDRTFGCRYTHTASGFSMVKDYGEPIDAFARALAEHLNAPSKEALDVYQEPHLVRL